MHFFLDMPNHQPILAPIPTTSTSHPLAIVPSTFTFLNGIDEIKDMMQSMMQNIDKKLQGHEKKIQDSFLVIQKMSNKVVTLERQQAQNNKSSPLQYQDPIHNRSPNQNQGHVTYNQNRPIGNTPTTNTNLNRALVPQNNLAQDQDFCPSYNIPIDIVCVRRKNHSYQN